MPYKTEACIIRQLEPPAATPAGCGRAVSWVACASRQRGGERGGDGGGGGGWEGEGGGDRRRRRRLAARQDHAGPRARRPPRSVSVSLSLAPATCLSKCLVALRVSCCVCNLLRRDFTT
jgi:hypothetical protein